MRLECSPGVQLAVVDALAVVWVPLKVTPVIEITEVTVVVGTGGIAVEMPSVVPVVLDSTPEEFPLP